MDLLARSFVRGGTELVQRIFRNFPAKSLREYSSPLLVLVVSRLIVLISMLIAARTRASVSISALTLSDTHLIKDDPAWWHYLLRWDSTWYITIIRDGYSYTANSTSRQTVAFFPLYPLFSWLVAHVLKIGAGAAAVLVANIACVGALLALYSYVRRHRKEEIAAGTVALLSLFPASFYLSAGYAESMSLLFAVICFLYSDRGKPMFAAVWCGLLTATRPTGIVMLAPLAYELWPTRWGWRPVTQFLQGLLIGCSGLIAYMAYLALRFHAPLAFAASEKGWIRDARWSQSNLHSPFTLAFLVSSKFSLAEKIDPWMYVAFLALTISMRKSLSCGETLYCAASLVFLGVTGVTRHGFAFGSMTRYMLLLFPVFIVAAEALETKPLLRATIFASASVLLSVYSGQFALWSWVD